MARTRQTPKRSRRDFQGDDLSVSSDSSDEVEVINEGTANVTSEPVATAVQVVVARPVTCRDLGISDSSDTSTSETRSDLRAIFTIKQRVLEGESLLQLLEQDLLTGLRGALKHQADPFRSLRYAFGETDFDFCYGLNPDLDFRIDRLKELVHIPLKYEKRGSVWIWKNIDPSTEDE